MSKAFFKITAGKYKGASLPIIPNKPNLIGRNKGDIILKDPLVSGSHARVTYESDGWYIEDLKTTNGTQVDGRSISKAKLRPLVSVKEYAPGHLLPCPLEYGF